MTGGAALAVNTWGRTESHGIAQLKAKEDQVEELVVL